VDCPDPSCSGHGSCVGGKCYCKAGWQGTNCSAVDQQVYQCLPGCSEHGSYDLETGACVCDNYWAGPDCSQGVYQMFNDQLPILVTYLWYFAGHVNVTGML